MSDTEVPGKLERRRLLTESIIAGQQPAGAGSARARLEQLLSPEALAALDEQVLEAIAAAPAEAEPEPTFVEVIAASKIEKRRQLRDALTGRTPVATPAGTVPSFDGGARLTPPQPGPTHDQTLVALLRDRRANVGRNL